MEAPPRHVFDQRPGGKKIAAMAALFVWRARLGLALPCLAICSAALAASSQPAAWPDTFVSRLEALALLQTLNSDLLSHDSATSTLGRWCDAHRLASPARIVANRVAGIDKPPSLEQRQELSVAPTDTVRYRRVQLLCGTEVLSEADNWYVPGRLTAEMNRMLEITDVPFGKVVQELHFRRRTLSSTLLWLPLPDGWEMDRGNAHGNRGALVIPQKLLEHRAVLTLPDGTPFSEVIETYTHGVLDFPVPSP